MIRKTLRLLLADTHAVAYSINSYFEVSGNKTGWTKPPVLDNRCMGFVWMLFFVFEVSCIKWNIFLILI